MDPATAVAPDLSSYDTFIVAMSGKDSLACLLHLLDVGVPREKIEIWHHEVDGREGSTLMDWPCTPAYARAVAEGFGLKIYYSWRVGGFEREMLRDNARTAPIAFETPDGLRRAGGTRGKLGKRRKFPQVCADLKKRWCSGCLKIDVCAAAIRNQARFNGQRTLVITGERALESKARSKYLTFEPHRSDRRKGCLRRHVDHWRPVHAWTEEMVWEIIRRHRVNPHPAYRLGWGRVSCAACIFGNKHQWASLRAVNQAQFNAVAAHEKSFGITIKRKLTVIQEADRGTPYQMDEADIRAALARTFDEPIFVDNWTMPRGAFGDSCGPT